MLGNERKILLPQGEVCHSTGVIGNEDAVAVFHSDVGIGRGAVQDLNVAHVHAARFQLHADKGAVLVVSDAADKGGLAAQSARIDGKIDRVSPDKFQILAVVVVHTAITDTGKSIHTLRLTSRLFFKQTTSKMNNFRYCNA